MWFDDTPDQRVGQSRIKEALATHADTIAVSCPFCNLMMRDGVAGEASNVRVLDVAELLAEAIDTKKKINPPALIDHLT